MRKVAQTTNWPRSVGQLEANKPIRRRSKRRRRRRRRRRSMSVQGDRNSSKRLRPKRMFVFCLLFFCSFCCFCFFLAGKRPHYCGCAVECIKGRKRGVLQRCEQAPAVCARSSRSDGFARAKVNFAHLLFTQKEENALRSVIERRGRCVA
jgi:hypothetical protein